MTSKNFVITDIFVYSGTLKREKSARNKER